MTEYAPPRSGQDLNHVFANGNYAMPHFSNSNGIHYVYNNSQVHYPAVNTTYPTYPAQSLPSGHSTNTSMCYPNSSSMAYNYQPSHCRTPTVPSQYRAATNHTFVSHQNSQPAQVRDSRFTLSHDGYLMPETEGQDSFNEISMKSEPVEPALEGYPDVKAFDKLMTDYVAGLSPKKQDKALIHARRAANIRAVLIDKKTTAVESAQFRFWVKKMFTLQPNDPKFPERKKKICHEGKPVAVREKLYKILIKAHKQCQHGGRDKTSAQVRKVYSWVPKELISRFVKECPTCQVRRGSARVSPPATERSTRDAFVNPQSPGLISPPQSRRDSIATRKSSISTLSPLALAGATSDFQRQNRWMTPAQGTHPLDVSQSGSNNLSVSSYNKIPENTPVSSLGTFNNTHGANNGGQISYGSLSSVNNDGQAEYGTTGLRFAITPAFQNTYMSGQGLKEENHYH